MWGDSQTDERTDRQKKTFWSVSTPPERGPEGTESMEKQPRLGEIGNVKAPVEGGGKTAIGGQSSMEVEPKLSDVKYGSTDVRKKYGMMHNKMANEVSSSMKYDRTVTPSVNEKAEVCDVNNEGLREIHNIKTTKITVSSKVWQKNNKKNVFEWKYVRRKKIICRPQKSDLVAPNNPELSANLGGGLGSRHMAGNNKLDDGSRFESENSGKFEM